MLASFPKVPKTWCPKTLTKKPCYRKETARRHSCSFRFIVRRVAKLRNPGFRALDIPAKKKQNLTQNCHSRVKAIQGHVFWGQWNGDKEINSTR